LISEVGIAFPSAWLEACDHAHHLEIFLPTSGRLCLYVVGALRPSPLALFGSGLLSALGWYTYYPSRTAIVIVALALVVTP
jgi:hypothetical protein